VVDAVGETPGSLAMGNIYPCADEAWPSIRHRRRVPAGGGLRLWCRGSGSAGLRAGVEEGGRSASRRHGEATCWGHHLWIGRRRSAKTRQHMR